MIHKTAIVHDEQRACGCVPVCVQDAAPCSGELLDAIKAKWGSLDNFTSTFNTTTAAVQVRTDPIWNNQMCQPAQRRAQERRHCMVILVLLLTAG